MYENHLKIAHRNLKCDNCSGILKIAMLSVAIAYRLLIEHIVKIQWQFIPSYRRSNLLRITCLMLMKGLLLINSSEAQEVSVDFTSDRWQLNPGSKIVDFMGRKCLFGSAELNDMEFENGVIEVDVAFSGARAFGGLVFRTNPNKNREEYYLRPHKSGLPDAQQYVPVFNGVSGWQLYVGGGYTASAEVPHNEWIHIKMEVKGRQARVFLNHNETPSMIIPELRHDVTKGGLGVYSSTAGEPGYYSNFKYRMDDSLDFDEKPEPEEGIGIIKNWEISQNFKTMNVDVNSYPSSKLQKSFKWSKVETDYSGLVNVSRYINRKVPQIPDVIFARTAIHSDKEEIKGIQFGYSDIVDIYLNGQKVFSGQSAFRQRDPNYLGAIGYNDEIHIPFKEGKNELLLMLWERSGGWGFQFREGDAEYVHHEMDRIWSNEKGFKYPEATVYDTKRNKIYVSNYNFYGYPKQQFISKLSVDGETEDLKWISGLTKPTGMMIHDDLLYIADMREVVVYNIETKELVKKFQIGGRGLLQDLTVDNLGRIYLSDGLGGKIYRLNNNEGQFELWLEDNQILRPNGLCFHNGKLLVGTFDSNLKSVDLDTKNIQLIHKFSEGVVDGIETDENNNIYLSLSPARLYRIKPSGKVEKLLDLRTPNMYISNFKYIRKNRTFIIPSLSASRVFAYRID